MNGADLLEDTVAHGTTAGYEAGCRSTGGCPGADGPWAQTCSAAKTRSRSDWSYGKAVAKDREVEFLEREAAARTEAAKPSAKVVAAKRAQEKQQGVPVPTARPKPPAPTQVPDVDELLEVSAKVAKPIEHGTVRGYQRGCRDDCPGDEGGYTCRNANRDAQRERAQARREQLAEKRAETAAAAPEPVVVEPEPVVVPEPVPVEPEAAEAVVEEPRPRGKRVLDDALRTLAEAAEMQRAIAEVMERALRTARIEINHMRRELAALESQQEK